MGSLYFRQLLAGRDFGRNHPFAAQMQNFVYLVGDRDAGRCLVVDPAWAVEDIVEAAARDGMTIEGALATHYHPDHVGGPLFGHRIEGLSELQALAPGKVHCHRLESHGIRTLTGLSRSDVAEHDSGDRVRVGDVEIQLLHTPGHTPGSLCFRLPGALVAGDTLFLQGCGRVDLPGGDPDEMFRTLTGRLATLPGDLQVYPGHNYSGSHAPLETVRRTNPVLQVRDLLTWRRMMG